MRLLRGGSLFDLARLGRIPLAQILKILRSVADALDYAHGQPHPIVHRDVKPANVLLDLKGNAYLSDFGIADLLQGTTVLVDTFQAMSAAAGTPPYMPSEQSAGRHVAQSDVYALGITAYELLTGQLPFMGGSYDEFRRKHANDPVPIPDPGVVSAALLQPVLKALEKDYRDRWASAGEFVRALDEAARAGDRRHTITFPSYELQFGPVVSLEAEEIQETQSQMASGFLGMQFKRLDDDFDLSNIEVRLFSVDEATGSRRILSKRVSPLKAGQHVFFKAWEVMNDGAYEVQVANPVMARCSHGGASRSSPNHRSRNQRRHTRIHPRLNRRGRRPPRPRRPAPAHAPSSRDNGKRRGGPGRHWIGLVLYAIPAYALVLSVLAIRMAQQSGRRF